MMPGIVADDYLCNFVIPNLRKGFTFINETLCGK